MQRIFIINFVTLKLQNHLPSTKLINAWTWNGKRSFQECTIHGWCFTLCANDPFRQEAFLRSPKQCNFHLLTKKLEGRMMEHNQICHKALACYIMSGTFFKKCLIVISMTTKRRLITSNIDSTTKSFLPFLMKILKISFSSFTLPRFYLCCCFGLLVAGNHATQLVGCAQFIKGGQ